MRKLLVFVVLMLAMTAYTSAQEVDEDVLVMKKVTKGEVPESVKQAVEKDFPQAEKINWNVLPKGINKDEWAVVTDQMNAQSDEILDYSVEMKGKDGFLTAIYDANGNLVYYKEIMHQQRPPEPIAAAIVKQYPGWGIVGDEEVIKNAKHEVAYYKVKIEKGHRHKILRYDPNGMPYVKQQA